MFSYILLQLCNSLNREFSGYISKISFALIVFNEMQGF